MSNNQMIVCPDCGGVNRVPAGRDPKAAKCGACAKSLFDGHPRDVDAKLFDRHVSRASIPVLVDVWAPWCGPCRMMTPAFEAAARQLEPGIRLIKLNSDAEQALAGRLGIRGIPTLLLYSGGREVARMSGAMTRRPDRRMGHGALASHWHRGLNRAALLTRHKFAVAVVGGILSPVHIRPQPAQRLNKSYRLLVASISQWQARQLRGMIGRRRQRSSRSIAIEWPSLIARRRGRVCHARCRIHRRCRVSGLPGCRENCWVGHR